MVTRIQQEEARRFRLADSPPKPPWNPDPIPGNRSKQLAMFGGLDRLAGTRDLYDVDGCSKLSTGELELAIPAE